MDKDCPKSNISAKSNSWQLGSICFDDATGLMTLRNYSWQTMSELFSTIAMYIGLSLKEFAKEREGVPQWCFDDLGLPYENEETHSYSKENWLKAMNYFTCEIDRVANLFLNFVDSDEKQEDVNYMFDELKKIYLSLWN